MNKINGLQPLFVALNNMKIQYCVVEYNEGIRQLEMFVKKDSLENLAKAMEESKFAKVGSSTDEYSFIYRLTPDAFWENNEAVTVHTASQMSCVSLSNLSRFKLPLDNLIQESIWDNKKWDNISNIWRISEEDYIIFLLSRCVFDTKCFDERSISIIGNISIDWHEAFFKKKLEGVFFRFTDSLIRHIEEKRFNDIIHDHRTFVDY